MRARYIPDTNSEDNPSTDTGNGFVSLRARYGPDIISARARYMTDSDSDGPDIISVRARYSTDSDKPRANKLTHQSALQPAKLPPPDPSPAQ